MSLEVAISRANRSRKLQRFMDLMKPAPTTSILDVGFADHEYSPVHNYLEKYYPYPEQITALGIDEPLEFSRRYPQVRAVRYPGRVFPFDDGQFDICWSNAVLEHVGDHQAQIDFLREIRRTCRHAFITTPNRFFPVEVHTKLPFIHWLPKPLFDRCLHLTGNAWAAGDYMRLLSQADIRKLLRDTGIRNCQILRNRVWGFTLDYILICHFA